MTIVSGGDTQGPVPRWLNRIETLANTFTHNCGYRPNPALSTVKSALSFACKSAAEML